MDKYPRKTLTSSLVQVSNMAFVLRTNLVKETEQHLLPPTGQRGRYVEEGGRGIKMRDGCTYAASSNCKPYHTRTEGGYIIVNLHSHFYSLFGEGRRSL